MKCDESGARLGPANLTAIRKRKGEIEDYLTLLQKIDFKNDQHQRKCSKLAV